MAAGWNEEAQGLRGHLKEVPGILGERARPIRGGDRGGTVAAVAWSRGRGGERKAMLAAGSGPSAGRAPRGRGRPGAGWWGQARSGGGRRGRERAAKRSARAEALAGGLGLCAAGLERAVREGGPRGEGKRELGLG